MSDIADYGVLDADEVGDERAAHERGGYLAVTTDLNDEHALAVAWKELGYVDTPIARELGVAPATVTGWLDRARAQYGINAVSIKPAEDRGDLSEVAPADLDELSPPVRAQYREIAVRFPGVVPEDVLNALGGDSDDEDDPELEDDANEDDVDGHHHMFTTRTDDTTVCLICGKRADQIPDQEHGQDQGGVGQ